VNLAGGFQPISNLIAEIRDFKKLVMLIVTRDKREVLKLLARFLPPSFRSRSLLNFYLATGAGLNAETTVRVRPKKFAAVVIRRGK